MRCPSCVGILQNVNYKGITLDRCARCDGLWFDAGELRAAKDRSDEFLKWIDIDLWADDTKFALRRGRVRQCPKDGVPLYEIEYEEPEIVGHRDYIRSSGVRVDVCNVCGGVWLDEGEFRAILDYLRAKLDQQTLQDYLRALVEEGREVFGGPEGLPSELQDFLLVQQLILYRIFYRLPFLGQLIAQLP